MKVTAFIGSARKKHTYHTTVDFLKKLQSLGDDLEYETVILQSTSMQRMFAVP